MFKFYREPDDPDGQIYTFQCNTVLGSDASLAIQPGRLTARMWCIERFGDPGPPSYGARWNVSRSAYQFWFRDEQDAIEFRLRWC